MLVRLWRFYVSCLIAKIVPSDRRFVSGTNLEDVCIILFSFSVSLQIDVMWLCLVSVKCIDVSFCRSVDDALEV